MAKFVVLTGECVFLLRTNPSCRQSNLVTRDNLFAREVCNNIFYKKYLVKLVKLNLPFLFSARS